MATRPSSNGVDVDKACFSPDLPFNPRESSQVQPV